MSQTQVYRPLPFGALIIIHPSIHLYASIDKHIYVCLVLTIINQKHTLEIDEFTTYQFDLKYRRENNRTQQKHAHIIMQME